MLVQVQRQSSYRSIMPTDATTPLLSLLHSVLCQDREQLENAMSQVRMMGVPPSMSNLSDVVPLLLEGNPQLAFLHSEHDKSLPLHFAASLGDVMVARALLAKVSLFYRIFL